MVAALVGTHGDAGANPWLTPIRASEGVTRKARNPASKYFAFASYFADRIQACQLIGPDAIYDVIVTGRNFGELGPGELLNGT